MSHCKLLIVGFDAMDGTILLDQAYAGRWPVFESIWKTGNAGVCWALVPDTGPSWTTIYTGQPSELHGVTDFWGRALLDGKSFSDVVCPFLWDWANSADLSTGIINLPITYPPRAVKGYMISGFPVPNRATFTNPPDLKLPDEYVVDYINLLPEEQSAPELWFRAGSPREALERMKLVEECKLVALRTLPLCDVMAIQFTIVDRIGHKTYGHALSWLLEAYDWCDYLLDSALKATNPETIVIISDHGFDSNDHTHSGVFVANGRGLSVASMNCQNLDVLPQILEILGIEWRSLPGKSNLVWKDSPPEARSIRPKAHNVSGGYVLSEQEQIEAQLRALGYIQ